MIDEIAVAVLSGAGGGIGQAAASGLWEKLRDRFRGDAEIERVLQSRDAGNPAHVAALEAALHREAGRDHVFAEELAQWWQVHSAVVAAPSVHHAYGLNVGTGTFHAPVTVTVHDHSERE